MPDSLIAQLVNEAWDDISKVVSNGLAFDKQKTLTDVVTVVTEKLATTTWQRSGFWGGGRTHVRKSATGEIFDYVHRFHLDYDALRSPSLDAIKAWSASARRFELCHIVGCLAEAATCHEYTTDNLNTVAADGRGGAP